MAKDRRRSTRLFACAAALSLLLTSCNGADGEEIPTDTGSPDAPSTTAAVPDSTVPTTVTTTTIPTTSVPPSTLAPPEFGPTTTADPPVVTTVVDGLGDDHVAVEPEDDLAALVDRSAPGTQFLLLPGVHRTNEVSPKDGMTFEGLAGTVMNGSQILDGFEATVDGWDVTRIDLNMEPHGECIDGYQACALRNDVFIDDQMLWRVDDRADLVSGTWWSDGRRVVIADDPEGRKVEISLTEHAFRSDADDVTIRGLVVEKYASMAQRGAIQAEDSPGRRGANWLIEDVEVRLNHAAGIRAGDRTIIRNAHIHHNGQQGITSDGGEGILVESSEIDHNNIRGFNWGWEGAGAKFKETVGLVVRDVTAHHNLGPGLWTDINCLDTTYEGNVVYSNSAAGIFHEISFGAVIRDNEVYDNGFIMGDWLWGAGILIAASSDVEVFNNTVTNNADGITGIQQRRESSTGLHTLENVHVYNNTITMWYGQTGVAQDIGDPSVFTDRNIVFENNTYVGAGHTAFAWDNQNLDWEGWLATGQGIGSTLSNG